MANRITLIDWLNLFALQGVSASIHYLILAFFPSASDLENAAQRYAAVATVKKIAGIGVE